MPKTKGALVIEARWQELMADDTVALTADELAEGWHFCWEWDGLLVGPGMKEQDHCICFEEGVPP